MHKPARSAFQSKCSKVITILLMAIITLPLSADFLDGRDKSPLKGRNNRTPVGAIQQSFKAIYEQYKDSVVFISTEKNVTRSNPFFNHPLFRDFGGQGSFKRSGLGTGFILSRDGYICTNHHVIAEMDRVSVKVNGKEYKARIVGSDQVTDLALLKINGGNNFKPVYIGDSDEASVGEWSIAIGNPFGLEKSFTVGVISAARRDVGGINSFLQTDASINPGNSGGPLINLDGEVIGVNRMIYSRSGGSLGIGFAIPINTAVQVLKQLRTRGEVKRGYLGIQVANFSKRTARQLGWQKNGGALVGGVVSDSPAEQAGIRENDIIVAINNKKVASYKELLKLVMNRSAGERLRIKIFRDGKFKTIAVQLRERP